MGKKVGYKFEQGNLHKYEGYIRSKLGKSIRSRAVEREKFML